MERLLGLLLAGAALMAAVGLFGTLVQLIQERRRELGIRMALGASRARLAGMVVRDGLVPTGVGLLVGAALAGASGRWMASWIFGVSRADAAAWAGAMLFLAAVALAAALAAARRAAHMNLLEALRCD